MIPTTPVNKGFGFLFEMGCGKTLTAIAVAGAGYQQKRIGRVLIVAPTSVVAVWPKEFQDYAAFPYTIRTLLGTKQQRLKALADLERFPYPHLKVAVINYESTWREEIFDALLDFDADLVIADESQRIKSHDAAQSKAMHQLGDKARYKLILSGTPVQNEAVDLWSQYRFLDPTIFGTNFYAFRSRYCEMGGFNRKQIVRYRDLDTGSATTAGRERQGTAGSTTTSSAGSGSRRGETRTSPTEPGSTVATRFTPAAGHRPSEQTRPRSALSLKGRKDGTE